MRASEIFWWRVPAEGIKVSLGDFARAKDRRPGDEFSKGRRGTSKQRTPLKAVPMSTAITLNSSMVIERKLQG